MEQTQTNLQENHTSAQAQAAQEPVPEMATPEAAVPEAAAAGAAGEPPVPQELDGKSSKHLYKDVLDIAWPSFVELMLTQLASMVDLMMVGQLGAWALTSVGLTTQPKFLLATMFMSMNVGATALVARFKGAGDRKAANEVLRQAILLTFFLSLIASTIGYIFADKLVLFMGAQEEATLVGGTDYMRIQMIGMPCFAMTAAITAAMRGVGNSRVAMMYNMVANIVNVIFNYLLIGGNLGFPRMEVAGASLATIIGQFVAFLIAYWQVFGGKRYLHITLHDDFRPDLAIIKRICNVGLPALLEQVIMRMGIIIYSKVVAGLGTVAFATHQICMNIQAFSFMNGQAFGVSATSLMGQSLGRKRPDLAQAYSTRTRRLGMAVSAAMAVCFVVFGKFLIGCYNNDPQIVSEGSRVLMMLAAIQPLQSSQLILAGALRGAGDTRSTAIISFFTVFLVRPALAVLMVNVFHWGLMGAWIAMGVDQLLRSALVLMRYNSGKWKHLTV